MPKRITEELVRKRAEHNNCEITTLEELSLHQLDIERIEHLDKWCRDLKILYLQSNLIPKIENVGRLKKLEYINLALNNITRIENLKGCESLTKLDLTVNFVGDVLSVESLQDNVHLRELFLTGNPCTDYDGYRDYVIATLPQLRWLDGKEITKSERIQAMQNFVELRDKIERQQVLYLKKQEQEKREKEAKKKAKVELKKKRDPGFDGNWYTDPQAHVRQKQSEGGNNGVNGDKGGTQQSKQPQGDSVKDAVTINTKCAQAADSLEDSSEDSSGDELEGYTPESRLATHRYIEKKRQEGKPKETVEKTTPRSFFRDGKPLNMNEGKYDFTLTDDEQANLYSLELCCPRFLDTSLIDADVQPHYVRVLVKGKYFQLSLQEEVSPDQSVAKRSQTTGNLIITMPKAKSVLVALKETKQVEPAVMKKADNTNKDSGKKSVELLEFDGTSKRNDLFNIVNQSTHKMTKDVTSKQKVKEQVPDTDFVDNSDVPPLV